MVWTVRGDRLAATASPHTVYGMAKMTDYVREGFGKRRRPWSNTDLPEWWDLAVWVALAGAVGAVVISVALGGGFSGKATQTQSAPQYKVQTLNPFASPSASPTTSVPSTFSATDFSATAAVQVAITGGGTTVVPAGAHNVALAAARAAATGDWTGIPLLGKHRAGRRTPDGTVIGDVTVADPAVTGSGSYLFSAKISHHGTTRPYLVQIAVEQSASGYGIRPR